MCNLKYSEWIKHGCNLFITMFLWGAFISVVNASPGGPPPDPGPIDTTTTLSFQTDPGDAGTIQNPVDQNSTIYAVAFVDTADHTGPVGGKLRIKQFKVQVDDGNGGSVTVPASCSVFAAASKSNQVEVILNELDPVNDGTNAGLKGIYAGPLDTSTVGSFGYAAQYVPSGGSGYDQSQSGCVDLVVQAIEACTPAGLSIAIDEADGATPAYPGTTYNGGFRVTVKNCGPGSVPGVTAQGGTSGWTNFEGATATTGPDSWVIRNQNKRNEVLLWTIGDMPENSEEHLDVDLTGAIKSNTAPGTILYLSGPWSAKDGYGIKTDYTGRVWIEVMPSP